MPNLRKPESRREWEVLRSVGVVHTVKVGKAPP